MIYNELQLQTDEASGLAIPSYIINIGYFMFSVFDQGPFS